MKDKAAKVSNLNQKLLDKKVKKQNRKLRDFKAELTDLQDQHQRHQEQLTTKLQTELRPHQEAWDQARSALETKYSDMFQTVGAPRQERIAWLMGKCSEIESFIKILSGKDDDEDDGPDFDLDDGEEALEPNDEGSPDSDDDPEDPPDHEDSEELDDDEGKEPDPSDDEE
jgi:hypothetical protein